MPTKLYFKDGRAKLEIGLAKGKTPYDKRETLGQEGGSAGDGAGLPFPQPRWRLTRRSGCPAVSRAVRSAVGYTLSAQKARRQGRASCLVGATGFDGAHV